MFNKSPGDDRYGRKDDQRSIADIPFRGILSLG